MTADRSPEPGDVDALFVEVDRLLADAVAGEEGRPPSPGRAAPPSPPPAAPARHRPRARSLLARAMPGPRRGPAGPVIERIAPIGTAPLRAWPAWPAPMSSTNPAFVGRTPELERIDSGLEAADGVVVLGDHGAGRTRMLQEYALASGRRCAGFQCLAPRDAQTLARLAAERPAIDLLILDDLHRLGWKQAQRLLGDLEARGTKVLVSAPRRQPPPTWLRFGARLATLRLPPLADDAILGLAGLTPDSICAARTLSLAEGRPLAAILAAEALDRRPGMAAATDRYGLPLDSDASGFREIDRRAGEVQRILADELARRPEPFRGKAAAAELLATVASFYDRWGYEAELGMVASLPANGRRVAPVHHVYAAAQLEVGSCVTVISCASAGGIASGAGEEPVEVGLVRRVHGAIDRARPLARAVATVVYCPREPRRPGRWRRLQLASQDFNTVQDMLKRLSPA